MFALSKCLYKFVLSLFILPSLNYVCLIYRYGITPENIILYGQSIGTVPTIDLAARYECAAVILHSPLMSGLRVAFPDTRKTYCFDAFPRLVRDMPATLAVSVTQQEPQWNFVPIHVNK